MGRINRLQRLIMLTKDKRPELSHRPSFVILKTSLVNLSTPNSIVQRLTILSSRRSEKAPLNWCFFRERFFFVESTIVLTYLSENETFTLFCEESYCIHKCSFFLSPETLSTDISFLYSFRTIKTPG